MCACMRAYACARGDMLQKLHNSRPLSEQLDSEGQSLGFELTSTTDSSCDFSVPLFLCSVSSLSNLNDHPRVGSLCGVGITVLCGSGIYLNPRWQPEGF